MPDGDETEWLRPEVLRTMPRSSHRLGRVTLLSEVARALLDGKLPSLEARLWFASSVIAWLDSGDGPLCKHLRITAPRGSHRRPQVLAKAVIGDEQGLAKSAVTSAPVATDKET